MPAFRSVTSVILLVTALCACAGAQKDGAGGAAAATEKPAPAKEKDPGAKRAALDRESRIAREKLARARQEQENDSRAQEVLVQRARAELELATARLKTFDEREAPTRLARSKLDLQGAADGLEDAKEELAQLELMYKDQDLADKTREIVIRRSQRSLRRTEERLALQRRDAETLEGFTLPMERRKLALDAEAKQQDLEKAERSAAAARHDRQIAILSAESEIARLDSEMAALAKESP